MCVFFLPSFSPSRNLLYHSYSISRIPRQFSLTTTSLHSLPDLLLDGDGWIQPPPRCRQTDPASSTAVADGSCRASTDVAPFLAVASVCGEANLIHSRCSFLPISGGWIHLSHNRCGLLNVWLGLLPGGGV